MSAGPCADKKDGRRHRNRDRHHQGLFHVVSCLPPTAYRLLLERVHHQSVTGHNGHVLLPTLPLIAHRIRIRVGLEVRRPELFAGRRVERTESAVVRRTDEYQPARGHRGACAAAVPDEPLTFRKSIVDAEHRFHATMPVLRFTATSFDHGGR